MHERLARCAARGVGQCARPARLQARPRSGQEGVEGEVLQPGVLVGSPRVAQSQGAFSPILLLLLLLFLFFFITDLRLKFRQVEKYFNSLPSNKVPKLGTAGEKYRDKQVVVQLPKQDLALTYCKHVEQRHHQSYEDFINARNEIALDIGYARECTYHVVSFYS